jgi:serine/threonine-protein kinase RsbW
MKFLVCSQTSSAVHWSLGMVQEHKAEQIMLTVPSRLTYVKPIQTLIGQLAYQLGFCSARVQDIELAIDEVCSNAIEHGSVTPDAGIVLTFTLDKGRLEVLVQDKGKKKKNNWLTTGRLDEISRQRTPESERGHGLYIARQLSDDLELRPNPLGGTDVRMVFLLRKPK